MNLKYHTVNLFCFWTQAKQQVFLCPGAVTLPYVILKCMGYPLFEMQSLSLISVAETATV